MNPARINAEEDSTGDETAQKRTKNTAVKSIRIAHSLGARPANSLSVIHPLKSIPPIPANSNSMITVPASEEEKPFAS